MSSRIPLNKKKASTVTRLGVPLCHSPTSSPPSLGGLSVHPVPAPILQHVLFTNSLRSADEKKVDKPSMLGPARKMILEGEVETKDVIMNPMRGLLGSSKVYSFVLGTALNMSSTGLGAINSVIGANTVASTTDFSSFATIFDEFFVTHFDMSWRPVGQFVTGPLGTGVGTPTVPNTSVSSVPFGAGNLHHGQASYTSLSSMANNAAFAFHQSDTPFHHRWSNVEDPKSGVVVVSSTTATTPSQGWCLTTGSSAAMYQGQVQLLSQAAPPALPATQVLGLFIVKYHVLFRCRQ